jgi:hypothetical protein
MNEMSDYRTGCGGFSMAIFRQAIEDIVYETSDLCRQVAQVAAQTVCPEAMRESGN